MMSDITALAVGTLLLKTVGPVLAGGWDPPSLAHPRRGWRVNAPNLEQAMEFVAWTTAPAPQARAAEFISYGPPRRSAAAMVGNIEGTEEPMGPNLPTFDANMAGALASDLDFWVDRDAELIERFNSWLAS